MILKQSTASSMFYDQTSYCEMTILTPVSRKATFECKFRVFLATWIGRQKLYPIAIAIVVIQKV